MLKDVSLRIEPGQTVAFVGGTGSGKSTLISLLPRLHEPPPGTVIIDGVDIREIPLDRLRGAIGFVPQEPFLFSDTIAENVAFGVAEARTDRPRTTRTNTDQRSRRPRRSRGSTRTSRTSRAATRRRWGSAASRCRAGRSSAPRWPAR